MYHPPPPPPPELLLMSMASFQGVQFHPESIITPEGKRIILNFVRFIEELEKQRAGEKN